MPRIEESIEIAAAPITVFKFCHDAARWPEWNGRVVGAELLSPKPVRRGTLLSIDAGRAGRYLFSWDAEYTEFQFPRGSTLRVINAAPSSPFKAGSESWKFDSAGGGTRFTVTWDYEHRNFIARVADALGRRAATRSAIRRSLANLKALIEAA
jgi:ribosome-associated toxin RatA of RatAB toxin-antitoxin module